MSKENFSVINKTKGKLPRLPFEKIKNEALGEKYKLSLVFIGDRLSRRLNKQYRGIDKATNILSFPLSKDEGEIFINFRLVKKQTKKFDRNLNNLLCFLLIHGLTHLKGFIHGSKMEDEEVKTRRRFNI